MQLDRNSFASALAHERGFVVISATVALIPLMRRDFITGEFALVSREDARSAGRFYWSKNRWGYPRRRMGSVGKTILLHREVMGCIEGDGLIVDHINRDKLDARKENLRFLTQAQNMQNQGARPFLTSRHRGVSFQKRSGKWVVNHKLKGVQVYAGAFDTEAEAAVIAEAWRAEHMPYAGDSSPYRGVSWDKERGKWKALGRIHHQTNPVFIGRFDSEREAADAAREWRRKNMPHATD